MEVGKEWTQWACERCLEGLVCLVLVLLVLAAYTPRSRVRGVVAGVGWHGSGGFWAFLFWLVFKGEFI